MESRKVDESRFMQALKRTSAAVLQGLEYRFELFSIELQQEKHRLFLLVCVALVGAFLGFMGFLALNVVALLVYWEDHRIAVATGMAIIYLAAAGVIALVIRHKLRNTAPSFAATMGELRKDHAAVMGGDES